MTDPSQRADRLKRCEKDEAQFASVCRADLKWLISEVRAMQDELAAMESDHDTQSVKLAEQIERACKAEVELALLRKPLEGDEAKVVKEARSEWNSIISPRELRKIDAALTLLESTLRDNRRMLEMVELQGFNRDGARACGEALDARKKRIAELERVLRIVGQDGTKMKTTRLAVEAALKVTP